MLDTLRKLCEDQVRDLFNAETQLIKALPRMAKAATNPRLRSALAAHLEETRDQVSRLRQIAEMLEIKPGGKKCKAMAGLIHAVRSGELTREDTVVFLHTGGLPAVFAWRDDILAASRPSLARDR